MSRLAQLQLPHTSQALNPLEQSSCQSIKEVLGSFAEFAEETNSRFSELYRQVRARRAAAGRPAAL